MKNKTFKRIIIALIFTFLIMLSSNIYASNFNTALEIDNSNQDKSKIVLVLKLTDVNFENIISAIEGSIEYNKEVFSEPAIEELNNWGVVYNNKNGKFLGFKISDKEIKQEDMFRIELKLNENVQDTSTQIVIKDIKSADGDNLVATEDRVINVSVSNGEIIAKEQKDKITDKSILKYLLIAIIIILIVTIFTSVSFLIQKYKMKKLYEGSRPKSK